MTRFLLAALAALVASAATAQVAPPAELPRPFTLLQPRPGDGPLAGLLRLRDAEADYRAADDRRLWAAYGQARATAESFVGDHRAALRFFGSVTGHAYDSLGVLPSGTRAVDAARTVAEVAADARVVMVNEAHHDASSRLLTLDLLPLLYARGFRYLAAETFDVADAALNARGYPVDSTGYYTRETTFAALVREALRLGYTLVPYEIEHADGVEDDTLSRQQRRDSEQARLLAERTVEADPAARVLVHAGYAHVYEEAGESWYPMAVYFRERTGIDPLTVDQTDLGEASETRDEHPAYRAADAAGLLGDRPVVLVDAAGQPLAPAEVPVDLQVVRPRAGDGDRPAWLAALPGRTAVTVDVPDCPQTCEVAVRRPGESAAAVPLDRLASTGGEATLVVPEGPLTVTIRDGRTGAVLAELDLSPDAP